jgi:hypothetical protein
MSLKKIELEKKAKKFILSFLSANKIKSFFKLIVKKNMEQRKIKWNEFVKNRLAYLSSALKI